MATNDDPRKHSKFWTGKTIAGAALTFGTALPVMSGYKRARLKGKSKGRAVGSALGAQGINMGLGMVGQVTGQAAAARFLKGARTTEEAMKGVAKAGAVGIGTGLAIGAGMAAYGVKKWKKTVAERLREKKLHPYS